MAFHFTTHALVRVVLFRVWRLAKQARFLLAFFSLDHYCCTSLMAYLLASSYNATANLICGQAVTNCARQPSPFSSTSWNFSTSRMTTRPTMHFFRHTKPDFWPRKRAKRDFSFGEWMILDILVSHHLYANYHIKVNFESFSG